MHDNRNDFMNQNGPWMLGRREFLATGLGLAAASLSSGLPAGAQSQSAGETVCDDALPDNGLLTKLNRRKLGSLEVSSLGLGCMSMVAGFYNPARPKQEMGFLTKEGGQIQKALDDRPTMCHVYRQIL